MVSIALWLLILGTCVAFLSGTIMGFYFGIYKARKDETFMTSEDNSEGGDTYLCQYSHGSYGGF